jgi:uncharacterized protein (DUF427 family)
MIMAVLPSGLADGGPHEADVRVDFNDEVVADTTAGARLRVDAERDH